MAVLGADEGPAVPVKVLSFSCRFSSFLFFCCSSHCLYSRVYCSRRRDLSSSTFGVTSITFWILRFMSLSGILAKSVWSCSCSKHVINLLYKMYAGSGFPSPAYTFAIRTIIPLALKKLLGDTMFSISKRSEQCSIISSLVAGSSWAPDILNGRLQITRHTTVCQWTTYSSGRSPVGLRSISATVVTVKVLVCCECSAVCLSLL